MHRLIAMTVLFCLAFSVQAAAPPVSPVREALDLRYFPGKDRQTLDVFSPRAGASRCPVVIFVHGGTWMYGDKNLYGLYRNVGRFLAKNGVVAVMINYRLSPRVKHPEHARDVARAYAWTRRNIGKYGGDPAKIILAGHSAGGHLASLVATDETFLKDPALKLSDRDRKALRGVASVCGVYRIPDPPEFKKMASVIVPMLVARSAPKEWVGVLTPLLMAASDKLNPFEMVFGADRDVQKKASPLNHVHKGLPPFLLMNSEWEVPGLKAMADDFAAALKKVGDRVEHKQIADCTHRSILLRLHSAEEEAGKTLLDFVRRCTAKALARGT
jgi:acetyl esterase/lipase